jgi:hypothetical protein
MFDFSRHCRIPTVFRGFPLRGRSEKARFSGLLPKEPVGAV